MKGMAITRNPLNFNRYQFLNRELQIETGLVDLMNRQYNPQTGRFLSIDPLAEEFHSYSPYNYAWNNPVLKSDPNGLEPCCGGSPIYGFNVLKNIYAHKEQILSFTDVNDVTVLSTTMTRGGSGINIDGSKATTTDKVMAGVGAIIPFVSGSALKKVGGAIVEAVVDAVKPALKIDIDDANKVERGLLNAPVTRGKGNAPTFKKDGTSVEIHHDGQKASGPFKEMHQSDHRMGTNYKKNHPDGQNPLTKEERKEFNKARSEYWNTEFPKK